MKCPPSPTNREPSRSSSRYQLRRVETTGVDEVAGAHGPVDPAEAVLQLGEQRGEPPVETDHQPVVAGALDGLHDPVELLVGQRQRLLDEHRLAALEGPAHEVGVGVVPGHHEDRVDRRGRPARRPRRSWRVSNPNLRWALTADSDRVVATPASVTPSCRARCGRSIDVA